MLVKVKLHGSGTKDDPYEVPLPTYRHVHGNITQGYAVVDMHDTTHPFDLTKMDDYKADATTEGQIYKLTDDHIKTLHAHFDDHYAERKGKFRLEQVP